METTSSENNKNDFTLLKNYGNVIIPFKYGINKKVLRGDERNWNGNINYIQQYLDTGLKKDPRYNTASFYRKAMKELKKTGNEEQYRKLIGLLGKSNKALTIASIASEFNQNKEKQILSEDDIRALLEAIETKYPGLIKSTKDEEGNNTYQIAFYEEWTRKKNIYNHLNSNIEYMIGSRETGMDNANAACETYVFPKAFSSSDNYDLEFSIVIGKEKTPVKVKIDEISVTLFYSGIGFFTIRSVVDTNDPKLFVDTMYYLNQIKRKTNLHFSLKNGDNVLNNNCSLLDFFYNVMNTFPLVANDGLFLLSKRPTRSDNEQGDGSAKESIPEDAPFYITLFQDNNVLSFSYAAADRYSDSGRDFINRLSKNESNAYLISKDDGLFYQPFTNQCWSLSYNGTAFIEGLTDNEGTNRFIQTHISEKNLDNVLNMSYYILFILRQHYKYYLELLEKKYSRLVFSNKKDELSAKDIHSLHDEGTNMYFRCDFSNPSPIDHINKYDDLLVAVTRIKESYHRFSSISAELDKYVRNMEEEKRARNDLKLLNLSFLAKIGNMIWTSLLAANEGPGAIQKLFSLEEEVVNKPIFSIVAFLGALIPQAISVVQTAIELNRQHKDLI